MTTPEPRPAGVPGSDPTAGFSRPADAPATPAGGPSSGPPSGPVQTQPAKTRSTGKTIGRTVALTLLVFITVLLVLFVVFNTQTVDISLVFTDVTAPLVLALVIAAVLGGLVVGPGRRGASGTAPQDLRSPAFRVLLALPGSCRTPGAREPPRKQQTRAPDGVCTCPVPTGR